EDLDRADVLGREPPLIGQRADQIAGTKSRRLPQAYEEPGGGAHVPATLRRPRAAPVARTAWLPIPGRPALALRGPRAALPRPLALEPPLLLGGRTGQRARRGGRDLHVVILVSRMTQLEERGERSRGELLVSGLRGEFPDRRPDVRGRLAAQALGDRGAHLRDAMLPQLRGA